MIHNLYSHVWTITIFCSFVYFQNANAEVPSVVSHYYVGKENRTQREVERKDALASLWVIRPVATAADANLLMDNYWAENRTAALGLRETFRKGIEKEYRAYGVPKGDPTPEIIRDWDTILKEPTSIVAITAPDAPNKILQIISLNYDSPTGTAMEKRFNKLFLPREETKYRLVDTHFIEAFGSFYELPVNSAILSSAPRVTGTIGELKTLIRAHDSTDDWVPLILRVLVATDLARFGPIPIAKSNGLSNWSNDPEWRLRVSARLKEIWPRIKKYAPSPDREESFLRMFEWYAMNQPLQKTVGVHHLFGEVHGDKLTDHYVEQYGFERTGMSFIVGSEPNDKVNVVRITPSQIEKHVLEKMRERKGNSKIHLNYHPTENSVVRDQPCVVWLSQIGKNLPPTIGTRGTTIGSMILW